VVTIRSDLNELQTQGKIVRSHGGALAVENGITIKPFATRKMINAHKKKQIANAAANLIHDAEVVFIDGGTTAAEISKYINGKHRLTVVTPSVEVAYRLAMNTNYGIYLLNGFLLRSSLSTIGIPDEKSLAKWNIAKAFVGAAGLTLEDGLTDLHLGFVEQKKTICKKARSVIGVIDSTKWGIVSLASFVEVGDIDIVVTDKGAPKDMVATLENKNTEIIIGG
jgi:DeoR family transcriptional regulator of aga operon/DeoR family fructose operon transcriptional repressor